MAKKEAVKLKEESEAEARKDTEAEDEVKKKPTRRVGGKLVKESEDEDCNKAEDEAEDEKQMGSGIAAGRKRRREKESEDEDEEDAKPEMQKDSEEEDMDDEEKALYRKMKKKGYKLVKAGSSVNPEESGAQSETDGHTITPGKMTGQGQNVFVPSSDVDGKREQDTPMGKSVDLNKSPLFVGMNKQLDGIKKSLGDKIDEVNKSVSAVEKSVNDRLKNMREELEKTEENLKKFYSHPFYKMYDNAGVPGMGKPESLQDQMNKGKVRIG